MSDLKTVWSRVLLFITVFLSFMSRLGRASIESKLILGRRAARGYKADSWVGPTIIDIHGGSAYDHKLIGQWAQAAGGAVRGVGCHDDVGRGDGFGEHVDILARIRTEVRVTPERNGVRRIIHERFQVLRQ
jgi:hypothetical protein